MLGTRLCNDTVELVQICIKVEHYKWGKNQSLIEKNRFGKRTVDSDPFHNIGIFRKHDNRLEISFHKSSVGKGAA